MSTSPPPFTSPTSLPAQLTTMCMESTQFQAFQGNPLNKLHLHRKDEAHISSLVTHDKARFLVLNQRLQPLLRTLPVVEPPSSPSTHSSHLLSPITSHLTSRAVITWFTLSQLTTLGLSLTPSTTSPLTVLLGQVDNEAPIAKTRTIAGTLTSSGDPSPSHSPPNDGSLEEDSPYHAILLPASHTTTILDHLRTSSSSSSYDYHDLRSAMPLLNYTDTSVLGQARALIEWHQSAMKCGKCGAPTISQEGGGKRLCTNPPAPKRTDPPPPSTPSPATPPPTYCGRTLYPRTDCVTITLTLAPTGSHVLLGRKREFPAGVYTCLAGFLEGGETPEEGARREVWEEAGVKVREVRYFASQPWPFLGGQLMVGMFGQCEEGGDKVELLDGELEEARWFSRDEVGEMLKVSRGKPEGWAKPDMFQGEKRVPPCFAIAHQLIAHWWAFGAVDEKEYSVLKERGQKYDNTNLQGKWIAHL